MLTLQRYVSREDVSTIQRTLLLWVGSNLGGTLWLMADFSRERLSDFSIALIFGFVAAAISLLIVPLVIPFFLVTCHLCAGWVRRSVAICGVILFYLLANLLLLVLLPFDSITSLLSISLPYLMAALVMVFWLYGPGQSVGRH